MGFNWTCPYCGNKTTINEDKYTSEEHYLKISNNEKNGKLLQTTFIVCPNNECKKITLFADLYEYNYIPQIWRKGNFIRQWRLLPNSNAKVFPDYIPIPLINDYEEAAKIVELSPKASATLSRRCLQGIIRDFWGISKSRLVDEINAIEDKVDPLTWKSIDAVRKVGNIGAHMEKDINLIIDVEPSEANLLLNLIEMLFEEWYIHKYEREQKLLEIVDLARSKDDAKKI
jgi:Domain of unknown function (DUF4145)